MGLLSTELRLSSLGGSSWITSFRFSLGGVDSFLDHEVMLEAG